MTGRVEVWPLGHDLRLSRWFDAGPREVFRAFTDPALLRQWWGPRGFSFEHLDFVAAVGHAYSVRLRAPDGTTFAHEGVFVDVQPPSRLTYTWRWTAGPMDGTETLVELRFVPERGGVTVHLCHSRFATQAECDRHVGWKDSFDALARWLSTPARE